MAKTPARRFARVVVVTVLFAIGVTLSVSTATAGTGSASGSGGPAATGSSSGSGDSGSGSGSGSGSASGSTGPVLPIPSVAGLAALGWAGTQIGKPYRWGGTGPDSWDCSGLVQWSFRQAGIRLPRTTWQQAKVGVPVPLGALAPGDIVVVNRDGSHVGIYGGFGQLFNAYGDGVPVGLAPLSHFHIFAIRRF